MSKRLLKSKGLKADIVKINPKVDSRGWADAVDPSTIDFSQYVGAYFTWNAPGHDGNYFMKGAEEAFRKWVQSGGIVWMDAFDDNYKDDNGNQIGLWMPIDKYPAKVLNTADSDIEVTPAGIALGIFSNPNVVDLAAITLDDNFADLSPEYEILATRKDGNGVAAFQLKYGKGYYIGMCIDTRDQARLEAAKPLIINALLYMLQLWTLSASPVNPLNSLPTKWGDMKLLK